MPSRAAIVVVPGQIHPKPPVTSHSLGSVGLGGNHVLSREPNPPKIRFHSAIWFALLLPRFRHASTLCLCFSPSRTRVKVVRPFIWRNGDGGGKDPTCLAFSRFSPNTTTTTSNIGTVTSQDAGLARASVVKWKESENNSLSRRAVWRWCWLASLFRC